MKLRYRILICISLTLLILVPGVYVISSRILMQSYQQLEQEYTEQNTDRAGRAFAALDASLHDKSVDWAAWDDTYQFMTDHNKAYIKSNLVTTSVASMKLDVILYVDMQGKLFHQFALKRFPNLPVPDGRHLWKDLHLDRPDLPAFHSGKDYSGVILHPSCPLFVSVRPILNSAAKGPQRGWLVFGRYFDKTELQLLAEQTRLDIQISPLDSPSLSREDRGVLGSFSPKVPIQIRPQNRQTVLGYTQIRDVQDRPILLLKITRPRRIYQQGLVSTVHLVRLIFLTGLVFSGVTLLFIEFFVLARLTKLTRQVQQIGGEGRMASRVVLPGRDELASLAAQINGMLSKLEGTTTTLHESQEALRRQNENLESIVTERTQELLHQAFHDTLTGLPNRASVLYHLKQIALKQKGGGKAVLFLDLDNFKFINDSLGHGAGDELLIAVAQRLQKCVRADDMVARLGGDEFIIVLEDLASVEAALEVAKKVLEVMQIGFSLSAGEGFTSASVGIAFTDSDSVEPDILIRDADTAMYHAKSDGKAAYALFEPGMNDRLSERVELEVGMRLALEQQQFCVHYQPLIDLKTGRLAGVEALVRWQHPTKGLISPGKFIPVAEETGLIIPLGYWVLEEACRQAVVWKQTYPGPHPFTVNVNLSGKQLQKPDVVERVREILEKTGMPAEALKIEITESVMMEDVEMAIERLTQLKSLGVKLALDDFGTGYSSMASLSSFPLDTVKIDRAFISRLSTHPDADSVVAAIILLAKSLHIDVTGEGVETADQLMSLQGLGCDIGQGYFFDRPLNAQALEAKLTEADNFSVKNYTETDKAFIEALLADTYEAESEELSKAA